MLFDTQLSFLKVSWQVILGVVVISILFFVFAMGMVVRTHKKKPTTGMAGMIGEIGEVYKTLNPEGTIKIHGEFWKAFSDQTVSKGKKVKVIEYDSDKLRLKVKIIE